MDIAALRTSLKKHGQEHLVAFWEQLSEDQREALYKDVRGTDLGQVIKYFTQCTADMEKAGEKVDDHLHPLPAETRGSVVRTPEATLRQYEEKGLRQVADSKVAVVLLAGGQGTRLGVGYPKGMYDVGLPSHKSLYQLQGERIVKLVENAQKLTGQKGCVPWYIMTSEHTKGSTEAYFQKHNYFGLNPKDVTLFEQHMLPCVGFDGKIILEKPHKIARAPNGNGGLYRALADSGVLDDLLTRGIEYVQCYCVDNILVKMADPVFLGFCISKGACCGAKVVEKAFPTEPVGVVCKVDNKYQVVEYSEITLKTAEKRNADGRLMFNAGNICNHFFTMDFLKKVCTQCEDDLLHHVAKKKIPFTNSAMQTVKPDKPNGIKMEKFVFDVFQFARDSNFAVWEVLREDEFAPLKNADGAPKDTPTTSRHALYNLHLRHVIKAGGGFIRKDGTPLPDIPRDGAEKHHAEDEDETVVCEISPLVSCYGEDLVDLVKGKKFVSPLVLMKKGESCEGSVVTAE